jgi:hypothetical protein
MSAPNWPVAWGRKDWTPVQRYIFSEEIQACAVPQPLSFNVNMVGPVIATFGSEAQKQRFLPRPPTSTSGGRRASRARRRVGPRLAQDHGAARGGRVRHQRPEDLDDARPVSRLDLRPRRAPTGGEEAAGHLLILLIDMKTPGITVRPSSPSMAGTR